MDLVQVPGVPLHEKPEGQSVLVAHSHWPYACPAVMPHVIVCEPEVFYGQSVFCVHRKGTWLVQARSVCWVEVPLLHA